MFLRLLGLVYVIAFGSLWIQLDGLIGRDGIEHDEIHQRRRQKTIGGDLEFILRHRVQAGMHCQVHRNHLGIRA